MILDWQRGSEIPGIEIPRRLYCVANEPALLAGMSRPRLETPWPALATAGFRWIVCLENEAPEYDPAPLQRLLCLDLEDLQGETPPRDPARERDLIHQAVAAVADRLNAGEGTIVHCWGGSGRTGVVLGCLLRLLGHKAEEIIRHLRLVQAARGKGIWRDGAWQPEFIRSFHQQGV